MSSTKNPCYNTSALKEPALIFMAHTTKGRECMQAVSKSILSFGMNKCICSYECNMQICFITYMAKKLSFLVAFMTACVRGCFFQHWKLIQSLNFTINLLTRIKPYRSNRQYSHVQQEKTLSS